MLSRLEVWVVYSTCFWRRSRVLSRLEVCMSDAFLKLLDFVHVNKDGGHNPAIRVEGLELRVCALGSCE